MPVRCIFRAACLTFRQKLWTSVRTNATSPRQALYEFLRQQELAVCPVQDVEEPVPVRMQQEFSSFAPIPRVDQDWGLSRVPIANVVGSELIMPLQLSGVGVQCQDAIGKQVIARPIAVVGIGKGITRGPV